MVLHINSDPFQFICTGAQTDFFSLIQRCFPFHIRIGIQEMIVMMMPVGLCQMFSKLTVCNRCCIQAGICTCLIQCDRIKACEHSDIRKDRCIILTVTITVWTDILNQCDMEMRASMTDCLCIFCHLTVKKFVCTAVWIVYCIKTAGSDTTATAFTFIIINDCFFIRICNRITSALFRTATASAAEFFIYCRLSAGMLFHLTCAASASHSDILESTAEAGCFMSFEVA